MAEQDAPLLSYENGLFVYQYSPETARMMHQATESGVAHMLEMLAGEFMDITPEAREKLAEFGVTVVDD